VFRMEKCCICEESLDDGQPTVTLGKKGSESLNQASKASAENKICTRVGQSVHTKCRRDFCRKPALKSEEDVSSDSSSISRHSIKPQFNSKEQCFFCGQSAKYDGRKKGFEVIPVRTKDFQDFIEKVCKDRNDSWSEIVLGRLQYAQDLHAADAVYHQICSVNFRTGKQTGYFGLDL